VLVLDLLLQPGTAGVPVVGLPDLVGVDPEGPQLRTLAQAALHLGEAGNPRGPDHVVPQPHRISVVRQPAYYRPKERDADRWLKMDDRRTDTFASQAERRTGLIPDHDVKIVIIERIRQIGGQTCLSERRLDNILVPWGPPQSWCQPAG
jgi:hypothetical protein